MLLNWQDIAVALMVLAACAYLARRAWLALTRRQAGCGACASCPSEADNKPLVPLDGLRDSARRL